MDAPATDGSTTSWALYIVGAILSPALLYVAHYFIKNFVKNIKRKVKETEEKLSTNHQELLTKLHEHGAHILRFEESVRKEVAGLSQLMLGIQKQMQDEIFALKKAVLQMDNNPTEYILQLKTIIAKLQNHPGVQLEDLKKIVDELKSAPGQVKELIESNDHLKGRVIVIDKLIHDHDAVLAKQESALEAARSLFKNHHGRLSDLEKAKKKGQG